MKKIRVSSAQQNKQLVQKLEAFKRRIVPKSSSCNSDTKIKDNKTVIKKTPELHPAKREKVEELPWLADRATANVKQWGERAKIDVDKVKTLAAQLKANTWKPATRIRYTSPSS